MSGGHTPVMVKEVMAALAPKDGGIYVDGTFGAGGYSKSMLDAAACTVWGIDRDPQAVARSRDMVAAYDGRLTVVEGRFGDMDVALGDHDVDAVDGVALDLGVSSPQIDAPERGFSFRDDGPLDMRMERQGRSAADVVNEESEAELADIIYRYGEERRARHVARAIVAARADRKITRTSELAEIVRGAVPKARDGIDPATRTFQALRIYVNDEMGELRRGLSAAERLLAPGGRLAVVSFHSLEDRTVKNFLRTRSGLAPRGSRHLPSPGASPMQSFSLLHKGATKPPQEELAANPRARSARLRAAIRTASPAWPEDPAPEAPV